jgi:hypothetical protein
MSLRRFAGYFMALTALATVAFASCLMGQATPEESAESEAARMAFADQDMAERTAYLLHQMQERHTHSYSHSYSHSSGVKTTHTIGSL